MKRYAVKEETEFGCKIFRVINTSNGTRINHYGNYELAVKFAERQNKAVERHERDNERN